MKSLKNISIVLIVVVILSITYEYRQQLSLLGGLGRNQTTSKSFSDFQSNHGRTNLASAIASFIDSFSGNFTLDETDYPNESDSLNWWLAFGGYFYNQGNLGQTIQGDLPTDDPQRLNYSVQSPVDTDNGYHPQNFFRLVTRSNWENLQQEVYFNVTKQNLSTSSERDMWNGLALLDRYQDSNNFYYTGINVDGTVAIDVIKNGIGQNLYQAKIFPGTYNRDTNPTLLPLNTEIGLRSVVETLADGSVYIKLYMDNGRTGTWTEVASAVDLNSPILGAYSAAIDTNFMDVQFSDYNAQELSPEDIDTVATSTNSTNISTGEVVPLNRDKNNPPVITRLGAEAILVTLGDVYNDAGATAYDNEDGDLTSSIQVGGLPDTNRLGDYTVIYYLEDSDHNLATQVTRLVQVVPLVGEVPKASDIFLKAATPITSSGNGGGGGGGGGSSVVSSIESVPTSTEILIADNIPSIQTISPADSSLVPATEIEQIPAIEPTQKLTTGIEGESVLKVQTFLVSDLSLMKVAPNGYFGPNTTKAVQTFQTQYSIVSYGTPLTTGFGNIGPKTRKKMNEVYKVLHKGLILFNIK